MDEYLPLSYLNHLAYCPRRFWYMYVQGEIAVNAPMLEGTFQHENAHRPGRETDDHGRTVHRRIWVWSDRLRIAGFTDFVELRPGTFLPVEHKHGKKGHWNNDAIQLCAQALCLEEMTGVPIPQGEIFYWRSRRRQTIPFTDALRLATETAVTSARDLIAANRIPAPITERKRCKQCSLKPICLPDEVRQLSAMETRT